MKHSYLICGLLAIALPVMAQTMSSTVLLEVKGASGDNLAGQHVTLTHDGYGVNYGNVTLDNEGTASVQAYAGVHSLSIERPGYIKYTTQFDVPEEGSVTVPVQLAEDIQAPTALNAEYSHDVFSGKGSVTLSWNMEPDVFFDDFESYSPFAIEFGEWTGLDLDNDMAAPLEGSYPNRGSKQYATIVNPLTVEPAWWYDYPILRPYSGKQYAGFIRTNTGVANNDWLITPVITPGRHNVFEFLAKSADVYNEKFQVYVSTKTDNPSANDFVKLNEANYETTTYKGWRRFSYDISQYEGLPVKFAIRYMSSANNGGAFMMMVDDVRVGKAAVSADAARSKRISYTSVIKSIANPNEYFVVTMDGARVGTTDEYVYEIKDVTPGDHTFGVTATYLEGKSEETTTRLDMTDIRFCNLTFSLTVPDGMPQPAGSITLTDMNDGTAVCAPFGNGYDVNFPFLPYGEYRAEISTVPIYAAIEQVIVVDSDKIEKNVALSENIVTPVNLSTSCDKETGDVTLTWNKNAAFTDSFEEYEDFAQDNFGDWLTFNLDNHITYPISLNNQIINYPGASTQQNPGTVGPIVFNAWETMPSMLPADPAMNAPTGNKQVLMFSPQQNGSNKWLVSPELEIMDGYVMRITAKSYASYYPESLEFAVTTDLSGNPSSMEVVSYADRMAADQWMIYEVPLYQYSGQKVRIGIHHVSYDTFFAQLDDFYVGNGQAAGADVDTGNVLGYEIFVDGTFRDRTTDNEIVLKNMTEGEHTLGVTAVYATGRSDMATVKVNVTSQVTDIVNDMSDSTPRWFRPDGTEVSEPGTSGIYIKVEGDRLFKLMF